MKFTAIKAIFLLTLCITTQISYGQAEPKTLFGGGNSINLKNVGFFVAPMFGITNINGTATFLHQFRGGISLGKNVAFGGYFSHSLNQISPINDTIPNIYMDYWSVGGFVEFTLFSNEVFHLTIPLFLGRGEVQMDNEEGVAGLGEAGFTQVEPSALLEVNLNKYVRLNLGAGYRIVSQMNYRNSTQDDISGLTGYLGVKIGLFR